MILAWLSRFNGVIGAPFLTRGTSDIVDVLKH